MKKFLIYYFFFLFFLLSIFISGVPDSQDGFQYLAVARNIYYTGKPTAPVYEYDKGLNVHMSTYVGKNGDTYSPTGLGFSLAMVPAVALTDVVYKFYKIGPPIYFPLENDWLILLTASFTNIFFGALLGVILFIYLNKLGLNGRQAFFISFVAMFTTNLFIYSKHTWAHMMFTVFLVLTALLIKLYADSKRKRFLFFAGISFGIMSITYNQTFILTIPALLIYYFILLKPKLKLENLRLTLIDLGYFLIGLTPFIFIYFWFENMRAHGQSLASVAFFTSYASRKLLTFPISVFIDGLYGQLFSPGRNIFLYSPIILIIVFFWHRLKKFSSPEMVIFLILSVIYIFFYAIQYTYGGAENGYATLWHGESSWGPRYLLPLLPFGILITGQIYQNLKKSEKILFFYPLIIIGFYVQFLGILMPYQIKFHDLQKEFYVNSTQFVYFTYSNLIPKFSPIFMMSKKLVKNISAYPKTLDHGEYNVKFYDGIDFPFNVGPERWRSVQGKGYVSFDNNKVDPVSKITLGLINHPLKESSSSASITFTLNSYQLTTEPNILKATQRELIEISLREDLLKERNNILTVNVTFDDAGVLAGRKQLLGIISFFVNNKVVNAESLDFPYYSPLGPAMVGTKYNVYGGEITDPWTFWDLHTQIYERTPDFWWMRTFYYWDYPKKTLTALFILTVFANLYFGIKVISGIRDLK